VIAFKSSDLTPNIESRLKGAAAGIDAFGDPKKWAGALL